MADEKGLSLEEAVNEVWRLRGDLSAKIILQEEEGYDEPVPAETFWAYGNWSVTCDQICRVVTRPEESIPDKDKINAAKSQLLKTYQSSAWYSARYSAGLALFNETQFRGNVSLWMYHLKKGLNASSGQSLDDEKRVNTVRDIAKLYSISRLPMLEAELKEVYSNNDSEKARREAAAQLGYSRARIWLHERLIK